MRIIIEGNAIFKLQEIMRASMFNRVLRQGPVSSYAKRSPTTNALTLTAVTTLSAALVPSDGHALLVTP